MKRLLIILSILFPFVARAATYPNYFVTNASPFSVVSGVSMYVPSLYSTNMVSTNLSVTDYLFIGTAQVNYLTMLGAINQQGLVYTNYFQAETNYFRGAINASNFFGNGSGLTNVTANTLIDGAAVESMTVTNLQTFFTNRFLLTDGNGLVTGSLNGATLTNSYATNLNWSGIETAAFTNYVSARLPIVIGAVTYYLTLSTNVP